MEPSIRSRLAVSLLAALLVAVPAARADDGPPAPVAPADGPPAEAVPAVPPFEAYVAVAGGDDIRVRAGPSIDYRVLDRLT